MTGLPAKIQLDVVTPDRMVLSELVDEVVYRAAAGYVGILPGHIPMLTTLQIGELHYRQGGRLHYMAVSRGFVEVLPDKVTVLATDAELAHEIDRAKVLAEKAEAETRLKHHKEEDLFLLEAARIEEAVAKLAVVAKPH